MRHSPASYPDYQLAIKRLKRRSYFACKWRARALGLVPVRRPWTAASESRLRGMFGKVPNAELLAAFPDRTAHQIRCKARSLKLAKRLPAPARTPWEPINAIKMRARELNYTMKDVDALARTKSYFARGGWIGRPTMNYVAVGRAVEALGGHIVVVWDD